jgi:hypothetical protein
MTFAGAEPLEASAGGATVVTPRAETAAASATALARVRDFIVPLQMM